MPAPPGYERRGNLTSAVSKEEIEDMLVSAGVRSAAVRARLLRAVDVYALQHARCPCLEEARLDEAKQMDRKKPKWKCPSCGNMFHPEEFPQAKRDNPRVAIPCLHCQELTPAP